MRRHLCRFIYGRRMYRCRSRPRHTEMAQPVLRPISPFDAELLAELHRRCFTEIWDRPWNAQSFADVLAMPGAAGAILSIGENPVGFGITLLAVDEVEL